MSIQIGNGSIDLRNVTTTRERLILTSTVNSNMVDLQSTLNIVNVTMNDFVIGKSNDAFRVVQNNNPLLSLSATQNVINGDTSISRSLSVTSNLNVAINAFVANRMHSSNLLTSNVAIACNDLTTANVPFVRATLRNNQEALAITSDGTMRALGPVGIGTTLPQTKLHVEGGVYATSNIRTVTGLFTPEIKGTSLSNTDYNLLLSGSNVIVNGNFAIRNGTFSFDDDLSLVNLRASAGIFGERMQLSNNDPSQYPVMSLLYDGIIATRYTQLVTQDVTLSNITTEELTLSNINPETLEVTLSNVTLSNLSLSNITLSNYLDTASNLHDILNYKFMYPNPDQAPALCNVSVMSINSFGRVGMGISNADAVLGLAYDKIHQSCNIMKVYGVSNEYTVIDREGHVGIGTDRVAHCLHIDPAQVYQHSLVGLYGDETAFLTAYSNNSPVLSIEKNGALAINKTVTDSNYLLDVDGRSRLQDLEAFYIRGNPVTCNIDFQGSQLSNIYMLDASNAYVEQFRSHVVDTNYIYGSNLSVTGFRCFSWQNLFSISLSNFWLSGQGALMSPSSNDLQADHISEGKLKIVVDTPPRNAMSRGVSVIGNQLTSIRVHSLSNTSAIELSSGDINLSNMGFISHRTDGSLTLGHSQDYTPKIQIDRTNNIRFLTDIAMKDGFFGIGTTTPTERLEVRGNMLVRNNTTTSTMFVDATNRRVGLGTTTPLPDYILHTEGGFFASATSRFNSDLTVGGRVGIGTTIANAWVSIASPNTFTGASTVRIINSTASNALHVLNDNASAMVIQSSGRIGVGTTNPQFLLHVNGDLNFDGSLFEKGSRYISSQWTSLSNSDLFFSSNVGIGTTIPQHRLHVEGNTFTNGVASFGSNITSEGTVYAKGSFVSTSDRTLKTNLQPIEHAMYKVGQLTGYTYDRTDTLRHECGLVAQEVLEVLPEVVSKDETDMYTIAYGNMAGLFVQAFKELQKEVQALREEVTQLRAMTSHT